MKRILYVSSTQTFSGKTAMCVGLLRELAARGLKVGYMKPVSTLAHLVGGDLIDEDALFVKSAFLFPEAMKDLVPVILNDAEVGEIVSGKEMDYAGRVKEAFETVSQDREAMVLEGGGSLREGWIVDLAPPRVGELLGGRHLVVVPYGSDLQVVDDLLTAHLRLGDAMLGAVINRVPGPKLEMVREKIVPFLARRGVRIFGVLPSQRVLLAVSVEELRDGLGGEVLCAKQNIEALVEHLMIGAMGVESALSYFRRRPNKAVITGGDRPDIQLAALETSTTCLILTGNLYPSPLILGKAEEAGVPIILTSYDTMTAVETIESFFGKTRFHQEQKVRSFEEILRAHLDFEALFAAMEL